MEILSCADFGLKHLGRKPMTAWSPYRHYILATIDPVQTAPIRSSGLAVGAWSASGPSASAFRRRWLADRRVLRPDRAIVASPEVDLDPSFAQRVKYRSNVLFISKAEVDAPAIAILPL
jgi:hypothetical protein